MAYMGKEGQGAAVAVGQKLASEKHKEGRQEVVWVKGR